MNKKTDLPVKNTMVETILQSIEDKKGEHTTLINLKKFDNTIADYFILTDATTNVQVKAISDNIQRQLRNQHIKPYGVEGEENAEWILLDYGDVIVHIFQRPVREHYDLESLWGDAEMTTFE